VQPVLHEGQAVPASTAALWLVGLLAWLLAGIAVADTYPSKPIILIMPAVAGSPPDVRARWLAEKLYPVLGQRVTIENKPGAGGTIGAAAAARSRPDGYTLLAVTQGTLAFNPHLYAEPGYDALKDFAPVTRVSVGALLLAVHPSVQATSVAELIRLAKEKPGQLTFGSAGVGTPPYMAGELFHHRANIDVTTVQYKGGNLAQIDVIAGRVTYTIDGIGILLPYLKAGKLKALAVTSAQRVAALPEIPTFGESGLPGYEFEAWTGICVPTGTPKEIIARLNTELVKILRTAETREWFAAQGMRPIGDSPEEFAAVIKADYAKWGAIIRAAGMKAE
jgi:tripartite-type tricarboxylate transporter receptor subunit TctC